MTDKELNNIGNILDKFSESTSIEAQMNELLLNYAKRLLQEVRRLRCSSDDEFHVGDAGMAKNHSGTITSPGKTTHPPSPPLKIKTDIDELKGGKKKFILVMNPAHEDRPEYLEAQITNCKQKKKGDFELEKIVFDKRVPEDETKMVESKHWYFKQHDIQRELDGKPKEGLSYFNERLLGPRGAY